MPSAIFILLPHGARAGGVTTWAINLVRSLRESDRAAHILAPGDTSLLNRCGLPEESIGRLGELPPLDSSPGALARWLDACEPLVSRLSGAEPSIWMPQQLGQGISLGFSMSGRQDLRTVWVNHSMIPYNTRVTQAFAPWLDAAVGVSEELTAEMRTAVVDASLTVRTISNAVPVSEEPPQAQLRQGPLRLIGVGRVEHEAKRVLALANLSAELISRGVDHTLTVVGDGPAMADLRAQATRCMRLVGEIPPGEIGPLLEQSDLFVQSSRYEGLSLAMLEAMARGTPPVVTRVGSGLAGVLEDGIQGVIADAQADDSPEAAGMALADAIGRACQIGLDRLSRAGWEQVRANHSLHAQASAFASLFDELAARPARTNGPLPPVFGSEGFGTVPRDAVARTAAVLARLRGRTIALHGSGAHTLAIAKRIDLRAAGVVCITDDNPDAVGGRCEGLRVVSPTDARANGVTDVVISTNLHEEAVWRRRNVYEAVGVRVHRVYTAVTADSRAADSAA